MPEPVWIRAHSRGIKPRPQWLGAVPTSYFAYECLLRDDACFHLVASLIARPKAGWAQVVSPFSAGAPSQTRLRSEPMLGKHKRRLLVFPFKLVEACPRAGVRRHAAILDLAHGLSADADDRAQTLLCQQCVSAKALEPFGDLGTISRP